MDEIKFFAGLTAVTLVVIALLVYLGLKLNRAVGNQAADINFPFSITLSGNALFACVVTFWICCAAIRALRPESPLGSFLNTPDGIATAIIGSILFAAIAGAVLEKLGYPIARKGSE